MHASKTTNCPNQQCCTRPPLTIPALLTVCRPLACSPFQAVDFMESIRTGIRESNSFIYIISPDSVSSKYCDLGRLERCAALRCAALRRVAAAAVGGGSAWKRLHVSLLAVIVRACRIGLCN